MPLLFIFLLVFGAVARFLPHPANFAPIAALGIYAGLYGNRKQAIFLPLAARIISDALIGFDTPLMMISIYLATIFGSFLGIWVKQHKNVVSIAGASVVGSVSFYLITNTAVWLFGTLYTKNLAGLMESYTLALPFFKNTLLGDIFYVTLFVGLTEFAKYIVKKGVIYGKYRTA